MARELYLTIDLVKCRKLIIDELMNHHWCLLIIDEWSVGITIGLRLDCKWEKCYHIRLRSKRNVAKTSVGQQIRLAAECAGQQSRASRQAARVCDGVGRSAPQSPAGARRVRRGRARAQRALRSRRGPRRARAGNLSCWRTSNCSIPPAHSAPASPDYSYNAIMNIHSTLDISTCKGLN